jgi:hypothetical protein
MPQIKPLHGKNLQATPGASFPTTIGGQFAFTDDVSLLDDANKTRIGEHSGFCTLVRVTPGNAPDVFQCEATFGLPDGQVTARGLVAIPRPVGQTDAFAVSGGTGKYDDIRGEVRNTKRSDTESDFTFETQG